MKKTLRTATPTEIEQWDSLLAKNPYASEPFQSKAFAAVKTARGWTPEFWVYETSFGPVYALALTRKIAGLGRVIYLPRGPSVIEPKQWSEICRLNQQNLNDAAVVKMEPPIASPKLKIRRNDLTKIENIQKSIVSTVTVNLSRGEDELLASFRQRARRAIRGGRREQLTVTEGAFSPKNVDLMWKLYKETAKRAGLKIRSEEYFAHFWREYIERDQGRFFFVWEPNSKTPLAGLFVCFVGENALYKDGGSRRGTKAHFSHLLQWETMLYLKGRGVKNYDLGGTPPSDRLDDPTHRLASLSTFKLSFGAPVIDYVGTFDQILRPRHYKRWRIIERTWRRAAAHLPYRDIY